MAEMDSVPDYIYIVYFFITGLAVGSFANVCIYRLPRNESVISPGSHCTSCASPVRAIDNIPLLSYLMLRGKCRTCGEGFSAIYPTIEVVTAFLLTAVYLRFGLTWECLIFAVVIPALVVITAIDIQKQIIPDLITLPGIAFGLICGTYLNGFWNSLIGFLVGGGSFLLIAELYFRLRGNIGMGGGDIKYIAAVGALLAWQKVIVVIFLASLIGALVGVIGMGFKKLNFLSKIPFGPFLVLATLTAIFYGDEIIRLYLGMVVVER